MADQTMVSASGAVKGSFGDGEYAEFMQLKAELKQRRVSDRVKAMGSTKANNWRQRMGLRRVDLKSIVPDEDLVAYGEIHKLKNPAEDSTIKTYVSDNEIAAYKVLDPDLKGGISLDAITSKVEELTKAGKLNASGDNEAETVEDHEGDVVGS